MSTATPHRETFLPEGHTAQLAEVREFLLRPTSVGQREGTAYALVSTEGQEQVAVPAELHRVLLQVVAVMSQGLAVSITPQTVQLTTQQAADLLGISRPTLVKLLEEDQIPFERVGTHRRLQLRDVLDYRERRRAAQYAALEATALPLDDEESVEAVLADLQQARKAVAERRRNRPA
ncbi:MAG: excisionase family DNA-binding protein [Nakamurella sp.]